MLLIHPLLQDMQVLRGRLAATEPAFIVTDGFSTFVFGT